MKRRFAVMVDVDTDKPGTSCARLAAPHTFMIGLRADVVECRAQDPVGIAAILAHELGHVVAGALRLQGHLREGIFEEGPQPIKLEDIEQHLWPEKRPVTDSTLDAEEEAWMVGKHVFDSARLKYLASYHKAYQREKESTNAAAAHTTK